jgi:hypothetical protein
LRPAAGGEHPDYIAFKHPGVKDVGGPVSVGAPQSSSPPDRIGAKPSPSRNMQHRRADCLEPFVSATGAEVCNLGLELIAPE